MDLLTISCVVFVDGPYVLVVLLQQVHRVLRHAVLHPEEEEQPREHPPRPTSRLYALLRLDGHEIRTRYNIFFKTTNTFICIFSNIENLNQ